MTERTITECILAARDRLTPENWHQGSYFKAKKGIVCMCAHGAVQAEVNPRCGSALAETTPTEAAAAAASAAGAAAAAAAASAEVVAVPALAAASAATRAAAGAVAGAAAAGGFWGQTHSKRPSWVSDISKEYGSLEAHYLMGMVGLTASYNDSHSTTLNDVKAKLTEAANLSASLGLGPVPA